MTQNPYLNSSLHFSEITNGQNNRECNQSVKKHFLILALNFVTLLITYTYWCMQCHFPNSNYRLTKTPRRNSQIRRGDMKGTFLLNGNMIIFIAVFRINKIYNYLSLGHVKDLVLAITNIRRFYS